MLNFKAKTKVGKWAVIFMVVFFVLLFGVNFIVRLQGPRAGQTLLSNIIISVPAVGATVSGVFAFISGVFSIWKRKERAILVYIATFLGFAILYFLAGEIIVPH